MDAVSGIAGNSTEGSEWAGSTEAIDLCFQFGRHLPDYQLLAPMGTGGQGLLFYGCQLNTDRFVAIKLIPPAVDGQASARALREARVLARAAHPNIANILVCGELHGFVYLVMDYIHGEPIDRMMEVIRPSVHELVAIYVKICRAVAFAHQKGIIHRDLKPSNVLLGADDHEPRVLDFGLARDLEENQSAPRTCGGFLGTLPYMSPEQVAASGGDIDIRSDVYSLGVLFYYVMSATFPYGVEAPNAVTVEMIREVLPKTLRNAASIGYDAPPEQRKRTADDVEKIIFKALEKDPSRRYQTADEMADDFERYLHGKAVHAKAMSRFYVFRKFLDRHRAAAVIGMVIMASSIGVGTAAIHSTNAWREVAAANRKVETARCALQTAGAPAMIPDLNAEGYRLTGESSLEEGAEKFRGTLAIATSAEGVKPSLEFQTLYGLAEMYYIANEPDTADPYGRKAIELAERMYAASQGDEEERASWRIRIAYARAMEGWAAAAQDRWDDAARSFREAEQIRRAALAAVSSPLPDSRQYAVPAIDHVHPSLLGRVSPSHLHYPRISDKSLSTVALEASGLSMAMTSSVTSWSWYTRRTPCASMSFS